MLDPAVSLEGREFAAAEDEIFSLRLDDFPRIQRLRAAILNAQPAVALERSRLLTDYYEQNGFDQAHPLRRQAGALNYVLSHLSPVVFPEELIVGSCTEHRLGCMMYPEFQAAVIWPELVKLPFRKRHPVQVSPEAVAEYSFRIFPYFRDKNIHEWAKQRFGYPASIQLMERMVFYLIALPNGVSHLVPDYAAAVQVGFHRIGEQARQKAAAVSGADAEAESRREFYAAAATAGEGVIALARNYAAKCAELAEKESDPERRDELRELSRMLRKVPAEPAETFWEALQGLWLTHVAVMMENSDLALSFGRMDQYLWPFYQRERESGRLDLKRALELVMAFYIKTNDHTPLVPAAAEALFSGSATNQSITLSGVDAHGRDATNELSYLFVQALNLLRLREPNVDARFHRDSPRQWFRKVLEVVRATGAAPALYNDEAIVPALAAKGAALDDARDYGVIGCVEPAVQGKSYPMTGSILLNLAAVLELTLAGGVHPRSGRQVGPRTPRLSEMKSFEQFRSAFSAQLKFLVDASVEAEIYYDQAHAELHPLPLLSALIAGPLDKGRDLTRGGARYNSSGVWVVGLADVVDSLAAVQKLVFAEQRITPAEMEAALKADFAGFEKIHAMCRHRAPKYGTDDPAADELAVQLVDEIDRLFNQRLNYRGGPYQVGYWSITFHVGYGKLVGALPNGRRKGAPLASGATPVSGVARRGPSASLSSTAKLPAPALANGIANNHKIPARLFQEPGKMELLEQLVRGYFRKGGMQLQFVIADKEMLRAAMRDPELAKDLLVRVSGYTAYFGDLNPSMQQEIIDRTEDAI